jgi:hypothetical protein
MGVSASESSAIELVVAAPHRGRGLLYKFLVALPTGRRDTLVVLREPEEIRRDGSPGAVAAGSPGRRSAILFCGGTA